MKASSAPTSQPRNLHKVAAILVALGPERSARILSHLDTDQVERILQEITRMKHLDGDSKRLLLHEFEQRCRRRAGPGAAENLARPALQPHEAAPILASPEADDPHPLSSLSRADPGDLLALLRDEPPQVIALVLRRLPPDKAASLLLGLPDQLRLRVALRVARGGSPSPEVAARLAEALARKASSLKARTETPSSGKRLLAEILDQADPAASRDLLLALSPHDPETAAYLHMRLLAFDDLARLDAAHLRTFLQELDPEELRISLCGAAEETRQLVLDCLPEPQQKAMRARLEAAPPVSLRDIQAAHHKIAALLRARAESGLIPL
jgi:flagellar motor switch protein FliG